MKVSTKGNFNNSEKLLNSIIRKEYMAQVELIAKRGVNELSHATPTDTGRTADSWYYTITDNGRSTTISWCNSNIDSNGTPIVILIRHGHVTNNGVFIEGNDFITPSMKPIFNDMIHSLRKALM